MLTSVICSGMCMPPIVIQLPIGITAIEVSAKITAMIGAAIYSGLYTCGGVRSSLKRNLTPSASGCSSPNGPDTRGSPAVLHVADNFALQPDRVGDRREQHEECERDLDDETMMRGTGSIFKSESLRLSCRVRAVRQPHYASQRVFSLPRLRSGADGYDFPSRSSEYVSNAQGCPK